MSNARSIEAVTATIRNVILKGVESVVTPTNVTTKPPDKARNGGTTEQVNLYLYQTHPNAGLQNMDMPGRTMPGDSGHPPLALDLYYLVTAYGEGDDDLNKGHRALGLAMRAIHDHPVLGRKAIADADQANEFNLQDQVERIRISPISMTLDEMSKLWNSFQTQHRISAPYHVSVVLIESERPTRTPVPVLARGHDDHGVITITEASPILAEIKMPRGKPGVELGDSLTVQGTGLRAEHTKAQLKHALLSDPIELPVTQTREHVDGRLQTVLKVQISSAGHAPSLWPIGFYTLRLVINKPDVPAWTTNALSFALCPKITMTAPVPSTPPVEVTTGDISVRLRCVPQIREKQSVVLLFGDRTIALETLTPPADGASPSVADFVVTDAAPREDPLHNDPYTLRLRVADVDSIPIDLASPSPQFNPLIQIKVVP